MKGRSVNEYLNSRMNIVLIIINTIKQAESTAILNESTLQEIIEDKTLEKSDTYTQWLFLETISIACSYLQFRKCFLKENLLDAIFSQIRSISAEVTLQALKIIKKLSHDRENQQDLYNKDIIQHLIYVFKWLYYKSTDNTKKEGQDKKAANSGIHIGIYRQISETFMNILQFHDNHNRILKDGENGHAEIIDCIVQLGRRIDDTMTTLY